MYNILYTSESEDNLVDIFSYIGSDNKFYAAKVINSIKNTIDILKIFPSSGKTIYGKNKMIIESIYKYKIVYEINENKIYIISIFKYKNLGE